MSLNGELIDSLPLDKDSVHTTEQLQIADMLFKQNPSTMDVLATEMREGIIICFLFILFESTYVNELIKRFVPSANSSYLFLVGIKSVLVVLLFYVIKNFSLSRKR